MGSFDILTFLSHIFGGLNVPGIEERAVAWLKEEGAEYPDVQSQTDALAAWITKTLTEANPELDPATMANTIKGAASDIIHRTAGVDPEAWLGGA
jgi:hypothetical protein